MDTGRETRALTSVGIDVGTTTTQVIVSRLAVEDVSIGGTVRLAVTDREIVYRGEIHETPLLDRETIDVDAVAEIVATELRAAGEPTIDTGAIIVTGETARTENAEPLAHRIAASTGEFVVATAGADLEAVLAGQGSGAANRAADRSETVINVDVGGGTTNAAVFDGDGVRETICLDVGGRLVRIAEDGTITGVSDAAADLAAKIGIDLTVGTPAERSALERLAEAMAERVVDALAGPPYTKATRSLVIGDLPDEPTEFDAVTFSGGVGRLLGEESAPTAGDDWRSYDDIGPLLATALRDAVGNAFPVVSLDEDIRATVVGAGTRTTRFSGNTVYHQVNEPLRNLPVYPVGDLVIENDALTEWFRSVIQDATTRYETASGVALAIADVGELTYDRIQAIADAIATACNSLPADDQPLVVVTEQNCAQVLGQTLARGVDDRPVVAIDELTVQTGDYLDIGTPIDRGGAVPVVIKTLAFE